MRKIRDKVLKIDEKEITYLTSSLIKFPTVNPPGEVDAPVDFIQDYLSPYNVRMKRVEGYYKKPNLIIEFGEGSKTLLLNSHIDVVTPGDEKWDFDPFGGEISGDNILGRGSSDTKGAIASMICGLLTLIRSGIELKGVLKITIVSDEENLGEAGTRYLADSNLLNADYAIVGEPTNLRVEIAERGLIWFDVISRGRLAHSGRPHLGINAIENLIDLIKYFRDDFPKILLERCHPLVSPPSISITMIGGGEKVNIIPDYCKISCDRRTIPGEDLENVIDELKQVIDKFGSEKCQFELLIKKKIPAIQISPTQEIVVSIKRNVDYVTGTNFEMKGKDAATDAYIINGELKISTVIFGPGDAKSAHQINERVEIGNLIAAAKVYAMTAIDILK